MVNLKWIMTVWMNLNIMDMSSHVHFYMNNRMNNDFHIRCDDKNGMV